MEHGINETRNTLDRKYVRQGTKLRYMRQETEDKGRS